MAATRCMLYLAGAMAVAACADGMAVSASGQER
jgi:hypothetical protein